MDAVVPGGNGQLAAFDADIPRGGDAVVGALNRQCAVQQKHFTRGVQTLISGRRRDAAGLHVEDALLSGDAEAVVPGGQCQIRLCQVQAVVCVQSVVQSLHRNAAPGDHKVVVSHNAVRGGRIYRKTAGPVQRQIIPGEDGAVHSQFLCPGGEGRAGHAVLRSFRQGQEDLVRLLHVQAGPVGAVQLHPVQQKPDLGLLRGVDDDAAV